MVSTAINQGRLPREFSPHIRQLCEGALRGGDLERFSTANDWLDWLQWSTVVLDENDYLEAAVHALDLAPKLAGTDYGTSRMRDLGQLWTDTIRGFLGEIAFVKWLRRSFGVSAELDYRKGPLEKFLPSDLKEVDGRAPRIRISIKTTKLRSIWLDVPYEQIEHSDIFVLVRVGVTREHFIAFLKKISVVKNKLLERAKQLGIITEEESSEVWESVPDFENIPSYVAGFIDKREYDVRDKTAIFSIDGRLKRTRRIGGRPKFVVTRFVGFWNPGERDRYVRKAVQELVRRGLTVPENADMEFEGIGEFSRALHFIAHSGALKKSGEEWSEVVESL